MGRSRPGNKEKIMPEKAREQWMKEAKALDARVAELSLERLKWEQRCRIAERAEVALERKLAIARGMQAHAESMLRQSNARSLPRIIWDRLRGRP